MSRMRDLGDEEGGRAVSQSAAYADNKAAGEVYFIWVGRVGERL